MKRLLRVPDIVITPRRPLATDFLTSRCGVMVIQISADLSHAISWSTIDAGWFAQTADCKLINGSTSGREIRVDGALLNVSTRNGLVRTNSVWEVPTSLVKMEEHKQLDKFCTFSVTEVYKPRRWWGRVVSVLYSRRQIYIISGLVKYFKPKHLF